MNRVSASSILLMSLWLHSPAFARTKVEVRVAPDVSGLSLCEEEVPTFFEDFFDSEVMRWAGDIDIQNGFPIQIAVHGSKTGATNARFARGVITVTLGKDFPEPNAKEVLQHIVAHEIGHLVFEKMSGLPGYESVSPFRHLSGVSGRHRNFPFLILALNEFYADSFSFYTTGNSEEGVFLRGPSASFGQEKKISELDPRDPYQYFSLSRKTIGTRFAQGGGVFSDLGRLYSVAVLFLETVEKRELDTLHEPATMEALNLRLMRSLQILPGYPLPFQLESGPVSCTRSIIEGHDKE